MCKYFHGATPCTRSSHTPLLLQATPRDPHGVPEVFAVRLAVASLTDQFHAQVDPTTSTAIIEPQGVVQLGGVAFSALEGTEVRVGYEGLGCVAFSA